uniref:Uncharacterized protein n=1 Tax=viral metagenome TaxID=1070528 RepID=A0A6C0EET2_9ZZZZ
MDDFNVSSLHESKNEWGARILTILTPLIAEGFQSIFDESLKLCKENNEMDKYLMTFQNLIRRIPQWNPLIVEQEKKRIIERSGCSYLEDLITCVHIIQLKILTAMRAGQKQKKIDITIPKLNDFIHNVYVHTARKLYKSIYLFELNIPPLQKQKYNREFEILIQESILNAIRDSIPIESILRAYMDESIEEQVTEEIKEEVIMDKETETNKDVKEIIEDSVNTGAISKDVAQTDNLSVSSSVSSSDSAPIPSNKLSFSEELEKINVILDDNQINNQANNTENTSNNYSEFDNINEDPPLSKLKIMDESLELSNLDIHNIDPPSIELDLPDLINDLDIEVLE